MSTTSNARFEQKVLWHWWRVPVPFPIYSFEIPSFRMVRNMILRTYRHRVQQTVYTDFAAWGRKYSKDLLEKLSGDNIGLFPKESPEWTKKVIWWSWTWMFPCGTLGVFALCRQNSPNIFYDVLNYLLLFDDILQIWNAFASCESMIAPVYTHQHKGHETLTTTTNITS